MALLRMLLAVAGLMGVGLGVRVDDMSEMEDVELDTSGKQGQPGGPSVAMASCPVEGKVMQTVEGFCKNAETGADLFFYCCNTLLACRADANQVLGYYDKYWTVYQDVCKVTDNDFAISRDGQTIDLRGGSDDLACSPACQTNRDLQEKLPLEVTLEDVLDRCATTVVEEVWKPQLDGAAWPMTKVTELEDAWVNCGGEPATTTTTTTPPPPSTTTSTTVTFTPEDPNFQEVDMSFMGQGSYQGYEKIGFWKWQERVIRKNVREEVMGNHMCARRGERDMTYFASSLCYWVPDLPVASRTTEEMGIGLEWSGSNIQADIRFCGVSNYKVLGKCTKCNVCHNNARNENGTVKFVTWPEEIPLSDGCRKESWIDATCLSGFDTTFADLIDRVETCQEEEAAYQAALTLHEQALAMIDALPRLIDVELPRKIEQQTTEKARLYQLWAQQYNSNWQMMNTELRRDCQEMVEHPLSPGYPSWWNIWDVNGMTPAKVLDAMVFAVPDRPSRDSPNYNLRMEYWQFTFTCGSARDRLATGVAEESITQQQYQWISHLLSESQAELARRNEELAYWVDLEPRLRADREAKFAVWNPKKDSCYRDYEALETTKSPYMQDCINSHYDTSCEKECVEIQKDSTKGCGVMEGAKPLDDTNRGGVRGACRPPTNSWIKGPTSWGASTEDMYRQCRRVYVDGAQATRHAQQLVLRGMMKKQSRWGEWQDRYYILESGDQVRSGVLRYWYVNPADDRSAPEQFQKAIILWDAKSVKKSGQYCLNLIHFYRTYKICVRGRNSESRASRNEWYNAINKEITFPLR